MTTIDRLIEEVRTDAPLQNIVVGAFWIAVVLDGDPRRCGLASSLADPYSHSAKEPPIKDAGRLLEQSARDLVEKLRSPSTSKRRSEWLLSMRYSTSTKINVETSTPNRSSSK